MVGDLGRSKLSYKKRRIGDDELTELDKIIIGGDARITIPLGNKYRMRQIADLLRGYAADLDFYSRRTDMRPRSILFHMRWEANRLNHRIMQTRGPGRPRKSE